MFLSSSVVTLIAVNGAIDHFMQISKTPDFLSIALTDGKTDKIADFLRDNETVAEYEVINTFNLINEDVTIISCQDMPGHTKYERTNTLCLETVPENFIKVFRTDDSPLSLASGEIAFPKAEAEQNHLQVGDQVAIRVGDTEQEFTIAAIVKDAIFGSTMMGFKRLLISEEDFAVFAAQEGLVHTRLYNVDYADKESFQKQWQSENFMVISSLEAKSTIRMCYIMDMLVAAILIVVSICLILLAFLVLRFTIVFTLQEDYKEIGIMKAIGIKDMGIKGLYLIKYLAISVAGAMIGFGLGFPFGNIILEQAIVNIVVDRTEQNLPVHFACAAAVVLIVLLFCYLSTNKLKQVSGRKRISGQGCVFRRTGPGISEDRKSKIDDIGCFPAGNGRFCRLCFCQEEQQYTDSVLKRQGGQRR